MLAKNPKKNPDKAWLYKKETVVFPLAALVVVVGISLIYIMPTLKAVMDKRELLKQEEMRLEQLVSKREALEALQPEQLAAELEVLNRVLPAQKPISGVIGAAAGVASLSAVTLTAYDFEPGLIASEEAELTENDKPGALSQLAVTIGVKGAYSNLMNYIRGLQASAPLIKGITIKLTGNLAEPDDTEEMTSQVEANVYYAIPPAAKGKMTDPLPPMSPVMAEILRRAETYPDYAMVIPEADETLEINKENPFAF